MACEEESFLWKTKEERQQHIKTFHSRGLSQIDTSRRLNVSRQTVVRDYIELELSTWCENVSDQELQTHIREIIGSEHDAVRLQTIDSYLKVRIGRFQEHRIKDAMTALGAIRGQPSQVRKRKCYASKGPDYTHSIDQNEKLKMFGFKIFTSIDVFSRKPIYFELVTDLRGKTHSDFYVGCLIAAGGAPANVAVDGANAWNGVREQVRAIHGDPDAAQLLAANGDVVAVRRFNQTSSVHNLAIERHWVDVNMVTKKWKEEFRLLEALGCFVVDDAGDTFSLTTVYFSAVQSNLAAHYGAMCERKKRKTTINPDYPSGTWRRSALYSSFKSHLTPLTLPEIEEIQSIGHASTPDEPLSEHQIDPLTSEADRAARFDAIEALRPLQLAEEYVAHRSFTKRLEFTPQARAEAAREAADGVVEFRRRRAAASW